MLKISRERAKNWGKFVAGTIGMIGSSYVTHTIVESFKPETLTRGQNFWWSLGQASLVAVVNLAVIEYYQQLVDELFPEQKKPLTDDVIDDILNILKTMKKEEVIQQPAQ